MNNFLGVKNRIGRIGHNLMITKLKRFWCRHICRIAIFKNMNKIELAFSNKFDDPFRNIYSFFKHEQYIATKLYMVHEINIGIRIYQ